VKLKFAPDDAFYKDVRARVDRYFRRTGRSSRDCPEMYVKTALVFMWLVGSYVALVFLAPSWWLALLAAVSLAMAVASVGFNVQHDGGHRSFSKHRWINRWMARSLDLLGASSFVWDHKHNTLHHTYANISGHDDDIEVGLLGRLAPEQRRLWFHRIQHFYMWGLYSFLALKWQLVDDFVNVAIGRIGQYKFSRPHGRDLVVFIGGKVAFFTLVFGVPTLVHPFWHVVIGWVVVSGIYGTVISVVFQLAHVVKEAQFPTPEEPAHRMPDHWAVHQVKTTVDFAHGNRLLTWYVGGLNYQVEHHLFPRICHVHYPRIARIVAKACERHGIEYHVHRTFWTGMASHFLWLRQMGRPMAA